MTATEDKNARETEVMITDSERKLKVEKVRYAELKKEKGQKESDYKE